MSHRPIAESEITSPDDVPSLRRVWTVPGDLEDGHAVSLLIRGVARAHGRTVPPLDGDDIDRAWTAGAELLAALGLTDDTQDVAR